MWIKHKASSLFTICQRNNCYRSTTLIFGLGQTIEIDTESSNHKKHIPVKVGSHDPILVLLSFKICVYDGKCKRSHDPIFATILLRTLKEHDNSCFENFIPASPQLGPAVTAILNNILQDQAQEN